MSNSDLLNVIEFEGLLKINPRSLLEFLDEDEDDHHHDQDLELEISKDEAQKEEDHHSRTLKLSYEEPKTPSFGEFKVLIDDEDGFKTPTSIDKKIPEMNKCPPAPRKSKTLPLKKRKLSSSSSACTRLRFDHISHEKFESMFRIKKARRENQAE
ncbi:hypothetical protein UlMin_000144 [Ulmus minor]